MENERNSEKLFGIEIFTWDGWDSTSDYGSMQFYNVIFPYESMKKYNGRIAVVNFDHHMEIYDKNGTEVEWKGYIIDIPEFLEIIKKH